MQCGQQVWLTSASSVTGSWQTLRASVLSITCASDFPATLTALPVLLYSQAETGFPHGFLKHKDGTQKTFE